MTCRPGQGTTLRAEELVRDRARLVRHPQAEALHLHPEVERGRRKCPRARLKLAGQRHKKVAGLGRMRAAAAQGLGKAMPC
jgi:hypothetical protein